MANRIFFKVTDNRSSSSSICFCPLCKLAVNHKNQRSHRASPKIATRVTALIQLSIRELVETAISLRRTIPLHCPKRHKRRLIKTPFRIPLNQTECAQTYGKPSLVLNLACASNPFSQRFKDLPRLRLGMIADRLLKMLVLDRLGHDKLIAQIKYLTIEN
jgi:hypothetical protein